MGLLDRLANAQESITPDRQDLAKIKFAQENDQERSRQIGARRFRAKEITLNKASRMIREGMVPEYFKGDADAFKTYVTGLNKRLTDEGGTDALTVSDMYKIRGKTDTIDYLNNTNLAPTYLGEGRYLDENNTQFGEVTMQDGSTKFGILPKIRTVDVGAEGGPTIYSADATVDGRKLRDIFAEGGDEAVDQATVGGVPLDFIDRVDRDHGMNVSERGRAERNFGLLSGSDFGLLDDRDTSIEDRRAVLQRAFDRSEGNVENLEGELSRIEGEIATETKLFNEAQAGLVNPQTGDLTPGSGAFPKYGSYGAFDVAQDPDSPGGQAPMFVDKDGNRVSGPDDLYRTTGADVNNKVQELKNSLFGLEGSLYEGNPFAVTTGPMSMGAGATVLPSSRQEWKNSGWANYTKVPGTYPFNANERQWNEMGQKGREEATRLENRVLAENANRWKAEGDRVLQDLYKQHESTTGSQTNVQDLKNDKVVKGFYAAEWKGNLQDLFNGRSDLYKEYKDDPYAFALKYADNRNGMYGLPVRPAEKNAILAAAAGANLSVVERAIETRDTETLKAEIAKAKKLSETKQKELVEFNTVRQGNHYRYEKPVRAATVISYAASLNKDDPVFKALTNPDVLSTYLQTGNFSLAQDVLRQKATATQVTQQRLGFEMTRYATEQAEKYASGEYSTAGTTFNTNYMDEMNTLIEDEWGWDADNENIKKLGVLIQNESGRIAGIIERDPDLTLPENKNDFLQLVRSQAQIVKFAILEEATPGWLMSWFYKDPNAEVLEINPNVVVLDKSGKPITDPSRASEAYQVQEKSSGDIQQISNLRNDFGISVVTHLITAARANELGLQ